ncbi:MAG: hypothetical protein GY909_16070 [Oligoflexia bacterium]|nr:hypothetical protein [Oligoflexia bacterium]
MNKLKLEYLDTGFCIAVYSIKNDNDQKIYYGIQEDGYGSDSSYRLMRLSQDHEPQNKVTLRGELLIDVPQGSSELEKGVRDFIKSQPLLIEA